MKLVADANILFALCNKRSSTSNLIENTDLEIFSPYFALGELAKYKNEIVKKSGESDFSLIQNRIKDKIKFVSEKEYAREIRNVADLIKDEKDIAYLALALHLNIPIWSNDFHLKEQSLIDVFTTKELIELIG